MKSVTHVITTIERGGAENQLLTLVEQQVKMGLVVSIVFLKGKPELEEAFKKIQVKEIYSLNGRTLIGQIHQLRKLLHGKQTFMPISREQNYSLGWQYPINQTS